MIVGATSAVFAGSGAVGACGAFGLSCVSSATFVVPSSLSFFFFFLSFFLRVPSSSSELFSSLDDLSESQPTARRNDVVRIAVAIPRRTEEGIMRGTYRVRSSARRARCSGRAWRWGRYERATAKRSSTSRSLSSATGFTR